MRNSNAIIRTVTIVILACNVFFSSAKAQMGNPEELIVSAQGYHLKVKHALAMMRFMQQQGSLSQNPSEYEIETVLRVLVQEFQADPRLIMQELENVLQVVNGNAPSQAPQGNSPPQPNHNTPVAQPQGGGIYNQQQAEVQIARIYKSHFPNARIDYNNAQAQQVKAAMGGMLLTNDSSKTYNSGSGDQYFGMTRSSSVELHVCQNGIVTILSSSRSTGGGHGSIIDSGPGSTNQQSWWSVATVNGQLCFMMADQQGVDALPMYIENGSVIISNKRYLLSPGQARCY